MACADNPSPKTFEDVSSFWCSHPASALVPAFHTQPLLQRVQMDLRIRSAQTRNIRLVSSFIEPSEHRVKLLPQQQANDGKGNSLELYRLAQYAAENLRSLYVCQLASGNLQRLSNELARALERQGHERSNVIGRNRLVWLVSTDGICQLALQDSDFHLVDVVSLHECNWSDYRCRQPQMADVVLDFPLALPMRDLGITFRSAH